MITIDTDELKVRQFCFLRYRGGLDKICYLFVVRVLLWRQKDIKSVIGVEEIHQTFSVKNAPVIFRNKSVALQSFTTSRLYFLFLDPEKKLM
jgi:hypothetical protein